MTKALFLLLLLSVTVQAGDLEGNGGDAVVCRDAAGHVTTVEVFDYFEARVLRGINVKLPAGDSPESIATAALAPLRKFAPRRAAEYEKLVREFLAQVQFVPNLVDVPDSDHLAVPRDCQIEQLVVQQKPVYPEDKRFLVNEEFWRAMDNSQRAGAMLHEAFYTEALANDQTDSRKARYFHSRMLSEKVPAMTDREYMNLTNLVKYPFTELRSIYGAGGSGTGERQILPLRADQLQFNSNGNILAASRTEVRYGGYYLALTHPLIANPRLHSDYIEAISRVEFPAGSQGVEFVAQLAPSYYSSDLMLNGQVISLAGGSQIVAHTDGSVEVTTYPGGKCYLDPSNNIPFCGAIWVDASGHVRERRLADTAFSGWSFENVGSNTKVRGGTTGKFEFYNETQGLVGRFHKGPLDLVFKDFSQPFIDFATLLPLPQSKVKIPLDQETKLQGQSLKENVWLYHYKDYPEAGAAWIQLSEQNWSLNLKDDVFFEASLQSPIDLNLGGYSLSSKKWAHYYVSESKSVIDSVYPIQSLSVPVQGKVLSTEAGARFVTKAGKLRGFTYSSKGRPIKLKTSWNDEKVVLVKGGEFVRISDDPGHEQVVDCVGDQGSCTWGE